MTATVAQNNEGFKGLPARSPNANLTLNPSNNSNWKKKAHNNLSSNMESVPKPPRGHGLLPSKFGVTPSKAPRTAAAAPSNIDSVVAEPAIIMQMAASGGNPTADFTATSAAANEQSLSAFLK